MEQITRIGYSWGLTDRPSDLSGLSALEFEGAEIPEEVVKACAEEQILALAGERGDPRVGKPVEVDYLVIETTSRRVEIRVYNRAVHLFKTDDEELRRIHRVCCKLQDYLPKPTEATRQVRRTNRVGRNEPCPCGSGLKFKRCCGRSGSMS